MSSVEEYSARCALRGFTIAAQLVVGPPPSGADIDWARITGLYLLVTGGNVPAAIAARAYGCSKQYVSRIMRDVEDRRDDPVYEAQVSALERRIFEGAV